METVNKKEWDCIIIGGGAAGLMCAAIAGARGRSVLVLDHANKFGKKILMSGGGRCNFTNYHVEPSNYLSNNPHFCKSALSRYTQWDFIALMDKHKLAYHEKTLGQLFCDNKASDVLAILLEECDRAGAELHTQCHVEAITASTDLGQTRYLLETSFGSLRCESLVIATGGLSIPTMGASGFGYDVAKQFGLKLTAREAALVPFTLKNELLGLVQSLAGLSLPVSVECRGQSFNEGLLFTHKGLSGPSILQISNYWHRGDAVVIDFLPEQNLSELIESWRNSGQKAQLINLIAQYLPKRFVVAWIDYHKMSSIADKPLAEITRAEIDSLCLNFQRWRFIPAGTEGYRTAEVTRGGVDTAEVSSKTFEAKKAPGLFFVGEVLDVTGWLGGFNFQWAWASGYCAGQYV